MTGIILTTAEHTQALGESLGRWLAAGDLVLLNGDLGAGKTTLTQGLARGLGVVGDVISPTFVIARRHEPTAPGRPGLVHVDAYRLGSAAEVDDIDLDMDTDTSVLVVEWGRGLVEQLTDHWLEVTLDREAVAGDERAESDPGDTDAVDPRVAHVALVGEWPPERVDALKAALAEHR